MGVLTMSWLATYLLTCAVVLSGSVLTLSWRPASRRGARTLGRRRRCAPDPMVTLAIQTRLGELARELRRVDEDPQVYARAHHWRAVQGAYDALLREACRAAGLAVVAQPLDAGDRAVADERLREELELSSRGWSW